MPRLTRDFPAIEPGNAVGDYVEVDFTGQIPTGYTLQTAEWQISVDSTDPGFAPDGAPTSRLGPALAVNGNTVARRVLNGQGGNVYLVTVAGTMANGEDPPDVIVALLWGLLPCRTPGQAVADMLDKRQRLAELIEARDTGALQVRHGDEMTTFRSLDDMNRIIAGLQAELGITTTNALATPTRRIRYRFSKGL